MQLENLPRFRLADFPTPIEYLETLTKKYNGPDIFIKRDDLTSLGLGGNKTRKLEFLVGEALKQNKDALITTGGLQSNHCRLTAAAARKAGLDCHLVLNGNQPEIANGNLLLDIIFGATIHYCDRKDRDDRLLQVADELAAAGKKPYVIPLGGSNDVGSAGYVNAMLELTRQLDHISITPDAVVFASSSGGTQAGLALGAKLTGFSGDVLGMSIDQTKTGDDPFPPILAGIANDAAKRIDVKQSFSESGSHSLPDIVVMIYYCLPGSHEFHR